MGHYIHGYGEDEQGRLTRMQALLNDQECAALDLTGVESIIDFGGGLGQMTRSLARRAKTARVVSIEQDQRQIEEAKRQAALDGEEGRVDMRCGSVEDPPLEAHEWGTFDLAHARFLLEHVEDPQLIVDRMVAAVRPRGRIVLMDDDHELLRFHPDAPEPMQLWHAYWQDFRRHSLDPLVGRRMPELLARAGADPYRVTTVFYGASCGMDAFDLVVDNLRDVMHSGLPDLIQSGRVDQATWDRGMEALARWRELDGATVWYSLPLVEGRRRTGS